MHFFQIEQNFTQKVDASITFGGLTRDSGHYLESAVHCMRRLGSHFRKSRIVIYENDSIDDTVTKLEVLQVDFISERFGVASYSGGGGLSKMAYFRSRLQEKILEKPTDYVAIFDLDILGLSFDGFFSSLRSPPAAAMFALGKCVRYPHTDLLFYDYFAHRERGEVTYNSQYNFIYQKLNEGPPFEVDSSFGGIALYSGEAFAAGSYDTSRSDVCEHVPFHESIRRAGHKLYLNPNMMVLHQ